MLKRLAATAMLLLAACGDAAGPTTTPPPPPAPTTSAVPTTPIAATTTTAAPPTTAVPGTDLRFMDFGPQNFSAEVAVTVAPGDASFLVWARAPAPEDEIAVIAVTDPAGELLYELDFDTFEVSGDVFDAPLADFWEVAMVLPASADQPLVPGDYVVELETLGPGIAAAGAIVRSGDAGGTQAFDVRLVDATSDRVLDDPDAFVAAVRDAGEVLLGPVGIEVGPIDVAVSNADLGRFAELAAGDTDEEQRELCRTLSSSLPPARAVDVVIVDSFVDPADDEGIVEGNAAGLPGVVMTPGAATSCVIVVADEDFDRDLLDRAGVVWHEAAHLLGLPHTSEADGSGFDFFADTPECSLDFDGDGDGFVDEFECPDGGNFMFHDTDSLDITDDQAWFLRRHPVLYPAG